MYLFESFFQKDCQIVLDGTFCYPFCFFFFRSDTWGLFVYLYGTVRLFLLFSAVAQYSMVRMLRHRGNLRPHSGHVACLRFSAITNTGTVQVLRLMLLCTYVNVGVG